jgi:hypothetical protein
MVFERHVAGAPRRPGVVLRERGGDEGGDDTAPIPAGVHENIAHKADAAALPDGVQ